VAAARTLPPGGGAALEIEAGLAAANRKAQPRNSLSQGDSGELDLDELLLVDSFLRRPPPELRVTPLSREAILRARDSVRG
jgi:hypothetical protein